MGNDVSHTLGAAVQFHLEFVMIRAFSLQIQVGYETLTLIGWFNNDLDFEIHDSRATVLMF